MKNERALIIITIVCTLCKVVLCSAAFTESTPQRRKRQLPLLYNGEVLSGIALYLGFGVPLYDDLYDSPIVSGYVFRFQYQLPASFKDLRRRPARSSSSDNYPEESIKGFGNNTLSKYRWIFYKGLQLLSDKLGQPGRVCVLKSICEAAAVPLHHYNGLLGEIIQLLLLPSMSNDAFSDTSDQEYLDAELLGASGASCEAIYNECHKSVLDYFTKVWEYSKNLLVEEILEAI